MQENDFLPPETQETTEANDDAPSDVTPDTQEPEVKSEPAPEPSVPLSALIAERRKAQQVKEEWDSYRESIDEKLSTINRPVDDFDDYDRPDPRLEKIDDIEKMLKEDRASREEQNKALETQRQVHALEQQFRSGHEDYDAAVTFLQERKLKEYEAAGFTPDEAIQRFTADARDLTTRSLDVGRNPAEVAYQMARTLGFEAGDKPTPKAAKKLEDIAQASGATLAATSGAESRDGSLTADELAEMSEAEFNEYLDKNPDAWSKAFA